MTTPLIILLCLGVYIFGIAVGFVTHKWLVDRKNYVGIMYVTRDDERVLYSLELHEDPEELEFMNEVIFKIDTSGENS